MNYPFNIRVYEDFCPECFKNGKSSTIKLPRDSSRDSPISRSAAERERFDLWMDLFQTGGVDPIQVINAYVPTAKHNGKVVRHAEFSHHILNLEKPGESCRNKVMCFPTCLICNGFLNGLPTITVDGWTVHDICCDPCGFVPDGAAQSKACKKPARTIPVMFKDILRVCIRCTDHCPKPQPKTLAPADIKEVKLPAPAPSSAVTPVHKAPSKQLPKPPGMRRLLPIERNREKRNHDIRQMFSSGKTDDSDPNKTDKEKKIRTNPAPAPSTGPLGAAFLYGQSQGFDFTPPISLLPPASKDPAHQEDENKAATGASDGEH